MKLASYEHEGRATYGVVQDGRITSLPAAAPELPPTLREALALGVDALAAVDTSGAPFVDLSTVRLLPVVPDPRKILCAGVNYSAHRHETGRAEVPYPTIFTRFADTQVADGDRVVRPTVADFFDYEGELAVVVGRRCAGVDAADVDAYVAGYACYNDFTARDWQRHTAQWTPGKNFAGTGAFGPWMVTSDEVADIAAQTLVTRVNGEERQRATIADMIFSIGALIAYVSSFTTLEPGDVVVTGTPGGVGFFRDPPTSLVAGDVVEVEITGVGLLRNVVG
jgi:2-keto-4-pentenoate hydratase/2-oxohepta-3-ene-1,7-dioic acid hydratase in catechol pathway